MEFSLDQIKEILDAFEERNMQKFQMKQGEFELVLEREVSKKEVIAAAAVPQQVHAMQHALPPHFPNQPQHAAEAQAPAVDANAKYIDSPMVGTFYASAAPGEAPFVGVGDTVKAGDVVCIIEAMKVMNEVKASTSGVVKEVMVQDGHPVEFGTKIFKIG